MRREMEDKSSPEYQRMSWEALKKSVNGLINKVSVGNLGHLIQEIFYENIVRGRGLFCRSAIRAQSSSTTFTNVYAAMIAIINTKMPELEILCLDDWFSTSKNHSHVMIEQVVTAVCCSSLTCSISRWSVCCCLYK